MGRSKASASAVEKLVPKRILTMFVFKQRLPETYNVEMGLRTAFASQPIHPVRIDVEHADAPTKTNPPMFAWRQFNPWNIDEKRQPQGSQVKYREKSTWETYQNELISVGILVLLLVFFIAYLLIQRKLRMLEEAKSQKLREELARISRVLPMGEITASICTKLNF